MDFRFAKMHGAANDFVVLECAPPSAPHDARLSEAMCHRRRGVGADGALFMERLSTAGTDAPIFRMHFYNMDGSRCRMCFNGARCCALRAFHLGWCGPRFVFDTDYGPIRAEVDAKAGRVALSFAPPELSSSEVELPTGSISRSARRVNTGDPHLVVELVGASVEEIDFETLARPLRWWEGGGNEGSNVHVVERGSSEWRIRSFERGVEAETWACGSGCIASVAALREPGTYKPVRLRTHGDDLIEVQPGPDHWALDGPAAEVFESIFVWEDGDGKQG